MVGRRPRRDRGGGVVLLALVVAQASLGLALDRDSSCSATQYEKPGGGGGCCDKCPPGQKVKRECSGESPTECEACESGHFQAGWTQEKHCSPHEDCDQTSHVADTVCVPCPSGFFSDVESATARCQPWSSCQNQSLVLKENGTSGTDVVCAPLLPVPRDTQRSRLLLLLLLPLTTLLLGGAAFCLRRRRDLWKPPTNKGQEPAEDEEECPALPIQETLLGAKSTPRDLGKDSRSVQLEQV